MKGFVIELQSAAGEEELAVQCDTVQDALDLLDSVHDVQLVHGLWLFHGAYNLKHGSFIDPSDLEVYGRQYYTPEDGGRCVCIEAHSEQPRAEQTYTYCETLDDFRKYLEQLSSAEQPVRLLHASTTFELHGLLVKGWNMAVLPGKKPEEEPMLYDRADGCMQDVLSV